MLIKFWYRHNCRDFNMKYENVNSMRSGELFWILNLCRGEHKGTFFMSDVVGLCPLTHCYNYHNVPRSPWTTPNSGHWWTKWAPGWGYIPATGGGEEDTLWWCPNIPRIIWRVSYPWHLIGRGKILHKWSLVYWHTVRGCPPLLSGLMKYSPDAMSIFSSRIQQGPIYKPF